MSSSMIYHLMIDRFAGADSRRKGRCFMGGNLQGIIHRLDYLFDTLGMDGIMLTPFYRSKAYHGYHILDYDAVDPHFGTWEDVELLVRLVHERGKTITADFVANHCHVMSHLIHDHPDWFLIEPDGHWKGFAGIRSLPMFDTDNVEVREFLTSKILRLCELGFDNIRLDHATGPTYDFWRHVIAVVKKQYPSVKLIGEVWGKLDFVPRTKDYEANSVAFSPQEARQMEYIGILDGVLDFEYHDLMCAAVREPWRLRDPCKLIQQVEEHFAHYPADFDLWLFLDNHDLNRFLHECAGNKKLLRETIKFTKQWNRPFLYYYGTEKGYKNKRDIFDGRSYADEDVRHILKWK